MPNDLLSLAQEYRDVATANPADPKLRGIAEKLAAEKMESGFSESVTLIVRSQVNARLWLAELEINGAGDPEKAMDLVDKAYGSIDRGYRYRGLVLRAFAASKLGAKSEASALIWLACKTFPQEPSLAGYRQSADQWAAGGGWEQFLPLGKPGEKAQDALARYEDFLSRCHHLAHGPLSWSAPVDPKDVAEAETDLGIKFPASYVRFVTERGTFSVGEGRDGNCNGSMDLLAPHEIKEATDLMREWLVDYDGEDFDSSNTFALQWARYDSDPDTYGFDAAKSAGGAEAPILLLNHDDEPSESGADFDQHISRMVDELMLEFSGERAWEVRQAIESSVR